MRRQVRVRLHEGRLPAINGVSKSHRGTGRPCIVCRRAIEPIEVERELDGVGVVLIAHEACYVIWREESCCTAKVTSPQREGVVIDEPDGGSTSGRRDRPLHLIAGKIAEIGDGNVPFRVLVRTHSVDQRTRRCVVPGQRVPITAVLIDGELIAQKIELAPR